MVGKPALISKTQHFVVHTARIADAQHADAAVNKLFRYPVYGHIALRANQHLTLTHQRFVDGFYQGGGLSRTRRSVHHGHILGPEHLVHGLFLRGIEPRKAC